MLVAVCMLKSAIPLEHTLLSLYCEPPPPSPVAVESIGGERGLGGRQNKLCPVFVPASAIGGVSGGRGVWFTIGELVAL